MGDETFTPLALTNACLHCPGVREELEGAGAAHERHRHAQAENQLGEEDGGQGGGGAVPRAEAGGARGAQRQAGGELALLPLK